MLNVFILFSGVKEDIMYSAAPDGEVPNCPRLSSPTKKRATDVGAKRSGGFKWLWFTGLCLCSTCLYGKHGHAYFYV